MATSTHHDATLDDQIAPEMVQVYREKTATQRLNIAFDMWRSGRKLITAAVRKQFPNWTDEQRQKEVARRMSDGLV